MSKKINPRKDPRCHCGGQFSAGGVETRKIPTGFGFNGSPKFQVDYIEVKSYIGFCFKCGKDGKVEFSRRKVTKFPRGINRKIAAARA